MQEIKLKCQTRQLPAKEPNLTRKRGQIPAELYGQGSKNQHLFVNEREFEKLYEQVGESSLITLNVGESQPVNVLVHEVQRDPITDKFLHVDFYLVNLDKEIETRIPLVFIGESEAVKYLSGTLVKSLEELEIVCLPKDLVSKIEVDISQLKSFNDVIRVADIKLPGTIKSLIEPERTVASAVPVKVVEEKPAAVEGVEAATAAGEVKEGETATAEGEAQGAGGE